MRWGLNNFPNIDYIIGIIVEERTIMGRITAGPEHRTYQCYFDTSITAFDKASSSLAFTVVVSNCT